jgi:butyryl-CoA dehydrogenase
MNFELNDEQKQLQEMFRDFAQKHVKPLAAELDEQERYPGETIPKLAEMGMMGIPIPDSLEGAGLGYVEYTLALEEVSKVCAATGAIISVHTSMCASLIMNFGSKEQVAKYVPDLASGRKIGAFAMTEPSAGSDAAAQKSQAVDKGDHWLLNGNKIFITNGSEAGTYVVFVMTDKSQGTKGISAFILEKGMPGFSYGAHEKKMGIRGSATQELIFEDVKIPKENLLGELGKGFKIAMISLDGGRIGMAAQAVGIAQGAIDETMSYVKTREQFGKRISQFQNTQFELADMQAKVDAARLLVHRAAWAKDAGKPFSHMAAMAKLFASETASDVTRRCLQLYGGYGYTRDYPIERMMRDAKITEIYEGTSEVMKMVIAAWMGVN